MSRREDLELLDAWNAGDEKAGNELFVRHFEAIYRFFRTKIENNVEDLVQQTFLACVRNRQTFHAGSSFRAYLFQVARSKLYDALRVRMRGGGDVSMCTMADLRTSPSTWMAHKQEIVLLRAALERLPLELQLAVELYYFEDQSAHEVALILELPEGTVRSRLRRAIESLRRAIEELASSPEHTRTILASLEELVGAKPET